MTVAVEWNGALFVFVKGADTSIQTLLTPNQKYLQFITDKTRDMAKTGLRSLWFAYKVLPAGTKVEDLNDSELEQNLTLLGATGIEDKLQDYVP